VRHGFHLTGSHFSSSFFSYKKGSPSEEHPSCRDVRFFSPQAIAFSLFFSTVPQDDVERGFSSKAVELVPLSNRSVFRYVEFLPLAMLPYRCDHFSVQLFILVGDPLLVLPSKAAGAVFFGSLGCLIAQDRAHHSLDESFL